MFRDAITSKIPEMRATLWQFKSCLHCIFGSKFKDLQSDWRQTVDQVLQSSLSARVGMDLTVLNQSGYGVQLKSDLN